MRSKQWTRTLTFFWLVHWGRLFFLVVLVVVLLATAGRALWQLAQPTEAVTGVIEGVEEDRISNRMATYGLSLRTNEDALAFIRLRNNGRILTYLLAQERLPDSRVIVRHRQGTAVELSFLDGATPTIREPAAPPAVSLLVLLPGLVVLLLLAQRREA
ncbi:MAG TPA: hypothetical protein VF177_04415 [Anaerolineae bacterium]